MNAYALSGLDLHLLRGSDAGQLRKDLHDRIADDYDAMTDVYTDTAAHLAMSGDIEGVLRAMDRASYMLGRLLTGEVTTEDPQTRVLVRELARQAELVSRRADAVLHEHAEVAA